MTIIWKFIPGTENKYKASTDGRIKSVDRKISKVSKNGFKFLHFCKGRIIKPQRGHDYPTVSIKINGKSTYTTVGYLVLITFIGPRPKGKQVCHYPDRNPSNNNLGNLRWGTPKQNYSDAVKHGTRRKRKLSDKAKNYIIRMKGKIPQVRLAEKFKVGRCCISDLQNYGTMDRRKVEPINGRRSVK